MIGAEHARNLEHERRLSEELRRYAGQWVAVAIREHQLIAHATTPERLDEQLASEHRRYRTFRVVRGSAVL